MKKYLTLLFLVCAVALTFTGCYNSFESVGLSGGGNHSSGGTGNPGGGSSDKPSGGSSNDSLAGTTWMYENNYESMTLYTLKFTSEENFTLEYKMMEGSAPDSTPGTYTYSNNTVILSPDTIFSNSYESRGSVSGNKMTFKNTAAELEDLVLTKQ